MGERPTEPSRELQTKRTEIRGGRLWRLSVRGRRVSFDRRAEGEPTRETSSRSAAPANGVRQNARRHGPGNADCCISRMPHARQQLGADGESMACAELERLGYSIVERNYRIRSGEIDIVANDSGTVVFVEVKTKADGSFGDPVDEVTPQKQRQIVSMGEYYSTYCCPPNTPCRFDVVTVDLSMAPAKITVYQDAFRPGW